MKKYFLITLLLMVASTAWAYDLVENGIYYDINGHEATVTYKELDNSSYSGDIFIPDYIYYDAEPYPVTAIGDLAFANCQELRFVYIPYSVTSIGNQAFWSCMWLDNVNIPSSVTSIGSKAFEYCLQLTNLEIPNSVTQVGKDAFNYTAWYDNQPEGLVYAGQVAYIYKGDMPEGTSIILNEGTTSIADYAFEDCSNLSSITLPNSVTAIGSHAFYCCRNLTEINIPDHVSAIGERAFGECSNLTSITLPNTITVINERVFSSCTNLTSVNIPESVTSIGRRAFECCEKLPSIVIPNSVTSIGEYAFLRCYKLDVSIGNSVEYIGDYAFDGCKIWNVAIPKTTTFIGFRAFSSTGARTMTVESGNPVYDSRDNCNAIIETSSNTLISGCRNTVIPNTVTTIGEAAFWNQSYSYVRIPSSVTTIAKDAFAGCWIENVTCLATTPPVTDKDLFNNGSTYSSAKLIVPAASVEDYKAATGWKYFMYRTYAIGDFNGSGDLTVGDVTSLVEMILSGSPTYEDNPAADVNGDGNISISDITALIALLLGSGN